MPDSGEDLLKGIPLQWDTFLDTPPYEADPTTAQVIVIPVPYDSTTSYKSGARYGPRAIINASRHLEDYDLELDRDISLVGIYTTPEIAPDVSGPEAMIDQVRRAALSVAKKGKLLSLLGGEHTIAIGAAQAMKQVYPDLSVLYLDAHADMRDKYMGTAWGHASVARRLCDLCTIVQVGVRSLSAEEMEFINTSQTPIFYWTHSVNISQLAEEVLKSLSAHVYVSVDLDVLDPSVMAAVGTPEPGGMAWNDVIGLLRYVGERRKIVGFDITELSPGEGPEACAYTAAKLVYKLIGYATGPQSQMRESRSALYPN